MSTAKPIAQFLGPWRFLSNFWPSPITVDGILYPTLEHAYQAAKTDNYQHRLRIASTASPGAAKRLGRQVKCREQWDDMKVDVMRDLLRLKFSNVRLRQRLTSTGDAQLIEGNNWHDTFWGVCDGVGENHLGKLLMELRSEIIVEQL